MALYLGCVRALPHPGAQTLSARGHQDTALCCHGQVASGGGCHGHARRRCAADALLTDAAAALVASCRCHCRCCHAATALPTAVLPLMTPRCLRAAKLTAAAALPPRFPPRCCR
jgi:hypothetical protein